MLYIGACMSHDTLSGIEAVFILTFWANLRKKSTRNKDFGVPSVCWRDFRENFWDWKFFAVCPNSGYLILF